MNERYPERKKPAHGVRSELNASTIIFATVCTKNRVPWLADEEYHTILRDVWTTATRWRVGRYVLMPDHMHFFAGQYDG